MFINIFIYSCVLCRSHPNSQSIAVRWGEIPRKRFELSVTWLQSPMTHVTLLSLLYGFGQSATISRSVPTHPWKSWKILKAITRQLPDTLRQPRRLCYNLTRYREIYGSSDCTNEVPMLGLSHPWEPPAVVEPIGEAQLSWPTWAPIPEVYLFQASVGKISSRAQKPKVWFALALRAREHVILWEVRVLQGSHSPWIWMDLMFQCHSLDGFWKAPHVHNEVTLLLSARRLLPGSFAS